MNSEHITKISVEVMLKGDDSKFFEFICELNKKDGTFNTPKEFIEFLFMTGFTFVRGQFIGSMMADMLSKEPPPYATFLGKMQPMMSMKLSPIKQEEDSEIVFDRVFFDGEPANHKISEDKQMLQFKGRNGKWHSIYLLNQNKTLTWKGDMI